MPYKMKKQLLAGCAMMVMAATSTAGAAADAMAVTIPAQPLGAALRMLAEQTGANIVFAPATVAGHTAPAISGSYTSESAVAKLLEQSGLELSVNGDNTIIVRKTSSAAMAQDAVTNAGADQGEETSFVLEEIIVTAQKRSQNMQDVPVAISAFSAGALEQRGIGSPEDLQYSVPNLNIVQVATLSQVRVTIRGVGTDNEAIGGDPGVPVHVDGHYTPAGAYITRDFFDVERVEVLRGPQGTLYGRNAIGGNINIITKRPTDEFEGEVGLELGNYNKHKVQAVLSGPISDNLRARVSIADEKRDGFVTNEYTDSANILDSDYTALRGALEYDASEDLHIYLSAFYYDDNSTNRVSLKACCTPDPRQISIDSPVGGSDVSKGASATLEWGLGGTIFRFLSSYNDTETISRTDLDGTATGANRPMEITIGYESLSQELQFSSDTDSDLKWIVGLYYYNETSNLFTDLNADAFLFQNPADLKVTSAAAFGQVDYDFNDQLQVTLGLRHTRDKKEMERGVFLDVYGIGVLVDSTRQEDDKWSRTTGKLGLNYHPTDDMMLYASVSTGYKAGGYNVGNPDEVNFDPEKLLAYEAGIKSEWLDQRLMLNMAAFYYDYTNKQEITRVPLTETTTLSSTLNAGKATIMGVEFDALAYVAEGLQLDVSLGYQDAEYDEFSSIDDRNAGVGLQDLAGNRLPRSPKWSMHVGGQYEFDLGVDMGTITARVDYAWVDESFSTHFNESIYMIGSYNRINANVQWESADNNWLVKLYGYNLADKDTLISRFQRDNLQYLSPRTYGVAVTHRF